MGTRSALDPRGQGNPNGMEIVAIKMFPAMSWLKQQTQDDLLSHGLAASLFDSWPIAIIFFEECSSIEPVLT
jgi:hypothetical protein